MDVLIILLGVFFFLICGFAVFFIVQEPKKERREIQQAQARSTAALEEAKQASAVYEAKILSLQKKLDESQQENLALVEKNKTLHEEKLSEVSRLEKEISELKTSHQQLILEKEQVFSRDADAKERISKYETLNQELMASSAVLKEDNANLLRQISTLKAQMTELSEHKEAAIEDQRKVREALREKTDCLASLEKEKNAFKDKFEGIESKEALFQEALKEKKALEQELVGLRHKAEQLEEEKTALEKEAAASTRQKEALKLLEAKLKNSEEALEAQKKLVAEMELDKQKLQKAETEHQKALAQEALKEKEALEKQLADLRHKAEQLEEEKSTLEKEAAASTRQKEALKLLEAKLKNSEEALGIQKKLVAEMELDKQRLKEGKASFDALARELKGAKDALSEKDKILDGLRGELKQVQMHAQEDGASRKQKEEIFKKERAALKKDISDLEEKELANQKVIEKLNFDFEECRKNFKVKHEEQEKLYQDQIQGLKSAQEKLEEALGVDRQTIASLEEEKKRLAHELNDLKADFQEAAQTSVAVQETEKLSGEIKLREDQLNGLREEYEAFKQRAKDVEDYLQEELAEAKEKNEQLKEDLEASKARPNDNGPEVVNLLNTKTHLEKSLERAQKELDKEYNTIEQLKQKVALLEREGGFLKRPQPQSDKTAIQGESVSVHKPESAPLEEGEDVSSVNQGLEDSIKQLEAVLIKQEEIVKKYNRPGSKPHKQDEEITELWWRRFLLGQSPQRIWVSREEFETLVEEVKRKDELIKEAGLNNSASVSEKDKKPPKEKDEESGSGSQ